MPRVRDIMTREVFTLRPDTTLREASDLFSGKRVSGAPVVANGRVVGVVSQSDILEFEASAPAERDEPTAIELRSPEEERDRGPLPTWDEVEEEPPDFFSQSWTELTEEAASAQLIEREPFGESEDYEMTAIDAHTVDEVMSRVIHALPPTADVAQAADYMRRARIHRVLVMEGEKLVGILSALDVAKAVADHRLEKRVYVFGGRADDRGEPS